MAVRKANSLETILTYENKDLSQWSVIWSTSSVLPEMGYSGGGPVSRRRRGRRRLQLSSLILGTLMTMHCRVAASALTGGIFVYMMLLVLAVAGVANPIRHFEVYLGQWSISGPGRAFRIIPMLDGIGIAICINAIVRAIICCYIAAVASIYVMHSISDAKLPFTYCRDFDLKPYDPIVQNLKVIRLAIESGALKRVKNYRRNSTIIKVSEDELWKNASSRNRISTSNATKRVTSRLRHISVCHERYSHNYPVIYRTPAYNLFYVEIAHLRDEFSLKNFNTNLVTAIVLVWVVMWVLMIIERIQHGKLIWNNIYMWFIIIPWIWAVVLTIAAVSSLKTLRRSFKKVFYVGAKGLMTMMSDAVEVALYIHSVCVGTETVLGKGLNFYASGHIDPHLDGENIWHSALLLITSGLHTVGAALCAIVDSAIYLDHHGHYEAAESTLWILPMYSKCISLGGYSHFMSMLVFSGLVLSYMTVAYVMLKTALHTIFEYNVKLIFMEQVIVATLILVCMGLSMLFATDGGLALLESIDSLMTGIAVIYVCCLELVGFLYVYRSSDFLSDMNVSMEDNACASRINWQWMFLPFIVFIFLLLKIVDLANSELPKESIYIAIAPLIAVIISVPIRAIRNAVVFIKPANT